MNDNTQAFWQKFLTSLPTDAKYHQCDFIADQWGDTPELATELGTLIQKGTKYASSVTLWECEAGAEEMPTVGLITMVLDGNNMPLCIIETTEVVVKPFCEVDEQFAFDEGEGEGDKTLSFWREVHWEYFSRTLKAINKNPTQEMPVICERFKVLFKGIKK